MAEVKFCGMQDPNRKRRNAACVKPKGPHTTHRDMDRVEWVEEPPTEPLTEEPKRMGATVRDIDGHIWRHGRTRWSCETPIGTRYFDHKLQRPAVVTSVGRLHWGDLLSTYGPLILVSDGQR